MSKADFTETLVSDFVGAKPPVSPIADRLAADSPSPAPGTTEPTAAGEPAGSPEPAPATVGMGTATLNLSAAPPLLGSAPEPFNPDIHEQDESGKPVTNKDGSFRKRRGRRKGSAGGNVAGSGSPQSVTMQVDGAAMAQAQAAAIATVQTLFLLGTILGGDEFKPTINEQINEPELLTNAWRDYYLVSGGGSLPPWAGVALATGAYFLPRLTMPKTASRLGQLWGWLMGKFGRGNSAAA